MTQQPRLASFEANPQGAPKGAVIVLGASGEAERRAAAFAAEGYAAVAALPPDGEAAFEALQSAVDAARRAGKVALVGYGGAGDLAYAAANRVTGLACVVADAGPGALANYREKRKAPTLLHFSSDDPAVPPGEIAQFRAHRPDVSAFLNAGSAQGETVAARTLAFVAQFVVGAPPAQLKNAGAYAQAKTERKKKKGDDDLGPPPD